jgi:hypothetical protein
MFRVRENCLQNVVRQQPDIYASVRTVVQNIAERHLVAPLNLRYVPKLTSVQPVLDFRKSVQFGTVHLARRIGT